jgi:hypothetical protein
MIHAQASEEEDLTKHNYEDVEIDEGQTDHAETSSLLGRQASDGSPAEGTGMILRVGGVLTSSSGLVPITRIPLTGRDITYSILFICHFGLIFALSTYDELDIEDSFIMRSSEALWTSMVLTVTILGLFAGGLATFLLVNQESRDMFISASILFSVLVQICLGNVLLHIQSRLSIFGLGFLGSSVISIIHYKALTKDISFNSAVIGFVVDVLSRFGISLIIACSAVAFAQTCLLLWWGVFLVDFVGDVPKEYLQYIIGLMLLSLYWIMQFFHGFMSYVVGGCFVWYFARHDSAPLDPSRRVLMHIQGALTCGFGSLCKGGLVVPPSNVFLKLNSYWAQQRRLAQANGERTGPTLGCCQSCTLWCGRSVCCPLFVKLGYCWCPITASRARNYCRLCYPLCATYGLTLSNSAAAFHARYPQSADLLLRDTGRSTLATVPVQIAGLIALLFGVFVARKEPAQSQLLFVVLIYAFSYCGISLAVSVFQAAVDALYVVFSLYPEKLAQENQILFLRILRSSEEDLS